MTSAIHRPGPLSKGCEDAPTDSAVLSPIFPALLPQDLTLEESAGESQSHRCEPRQRRERQGEGGRVAQGKRGWWHSCYQDSWTISFILQFLPFWNRDSSWGVLERCCTTASMNQEHTVWNTENPNPCVWVHFLFIINYCFRVRLEPRQSREEENLNWDLAVVCTGNMAGAAVPICQNLEHGRGWKGLPWQVSIPHPRKEVTGAV